jgi:hypothetical protein
MPQDICNLDPVLGELSEVKELIVWDDWVPTTTGGYPINPNAIKRVNLLRGFIFPVGPSR